MNKWLQFIRNNYFSFLLVIASFVVFAIVFNKILFHLLTVDSITFNDPVFHWYKAIDISGFIFLLTYGSLLLYMILNRKEPLKYYLFIKSYAILLMMRSISVFLLPLACSSDAIPLNDPVLNNLFYPQGYACNDLFFSGHMATVFMMYLFSENKYQKGGFLFLSILTGLAVLLQKVHYSIDVLAAPLFAYVCYRLTLLNFPPIKNN